MISDQDRKLASGTEVITSTGRRGKTVGQPYVAVNGKLLVRVAIEGRRGTTANQVARLTLVPATISDEDRKLAEETFDFIERSEHVQAEQPAVTPEPGDWGFELEWQPGQHFMFDGPDVSMALAEHTASAIDKILGA